MSMEIEIDSTSGLNIKIDVSSLMDSCRVCMAQRLHMSCIFDTEKKNIIDDIKFCTGLTIKQEQGLPTQICELCLRNLSVAYKFKTSCLVADETFRKLILSSAIKTEDTEVSDVDYDIINYKDEEIFEEEPLKKEVTEEFEVPIEQNVEKKRVRVRVKKESDGPRRRRGRPKKAAGPSKPGRQKKFKFKRLCCEPCDMKFDNKKQSDEHRMTVHKDSETWVCEICGKVFLHRASHYTHVKSHQPPKYMCDKCDYKTWHKYDLVKHIRIHEGLKLYQCEYCTQSYYTSSNLTSHIRRIHMNEKPHDCSICRRRFFDMTKLNRHLDSHLEIKRFECDICHACFTRRCYWKKHLLIKHEIDTPRQRPGRQKTNLVIGEYLINTKQSWQNDNKLKIDDEINND